MRRTLHGAVALVITVMLLTGCADSGDETRQDEGKGKTAATDASSGTASQKATYRVTLKVTGKGTTSIMYIVNSNHFEQQRKLPWTKTETVALTSAEQKVGHLVSIVPGSIQAADGTLQQAPCVIEVDGKQVADNDGGNDPKGCRYELK
ncbi:hypothetical protein ACFOOM_21865 [Streptomyces echinoruber]|uniref:Lipoprotein n=1 Tax=Streptomyces echinoruber TaxID=68898 RepID=A0A918R1M2_9ACTN|nr:hypothetical protein [Streptomyces echinoruber]GGZ81538.1 hypothetical protein GCM10010389_19120 [Streptomyces echinoruber]